jgi:hypothetical protein
VPVEGQTVGLSWEEKDEMTFAEDGTRMAV